MEKLFCYVDESGQDTKGRFFVVSVVIAKRERDRLVSELEAIERSSGKGAVKWTKAKHDARIAYARSVLQCEWLRDALYYDVWSESRDFISLTVLTIARAVLQSAGEDHKATVFMDGLRKSGYGRFPRMLSAVNVRVKKVRGGRDESSALLRLADALCGLVRDAEEGKQQYASLLEKAKSKGMVRSG